MHEAEADQEARAATEDMTSSIIIIEDSATQFNVAPPRAHIQKRSSKQRSCLQSY